MPRVQADPALQEALTRNGKRVELLDAAGNVIGVAYSVNSIHAHDDEPVDPNEIRSILTPQRYTHDTVMRMLGFK
jgi:hypothetical protein